MGQQVASSVKRYTFREGRWNQADAEPLGKVCNEILEDGLKLTPNAVVDHAKHPSSPIHHMFEWDDKVAGHRWRCRQAKDYVGALEITVYQAQVPAPGKALVSLSIEDSAGIPHNWMGENNRHYVPVEEAMADPVKKAQLRDNLLRDLRSWRTRVEKLDMCEAFGTICAAIDAFGK